MNYLYLVALLCLPIIGFSQHTIVEAYPDNSFTIEEYEYQNIPSPEKDWGKEELKAFIKFMEKIYTEDKWSLPRKDSPYSGKLFDKMVNKANLKPITDKSIPIEDRINDIDLHLEYSNFIISIYKEDNRTTERFGEETLAAFEYLVYSAQSVRLFFDELKISLPANATQSRDFINIHNSSTQQLADLMNVILLTFEKDTDRYDHEVLASFATNARTIISDNWSIITKEHQKKLMKTLTSLQAHKNDVVAAEMKKLYNELNKA